MIGNPDGTSAGWLYPDLLIDGTANPPFASEVSFRGLNGNVTEQELDLLEFAACRVALKFWA